MLLFFKGASKRAFFLAHLPFCPQAGQWCWRRSAPGSGDGSERRPWHSGAVHDFIRTPYNRGTLTGYDITG
jgi:hypothetical protein